MNRQSVRIWLVAIALLLGGCSDGKRLEEQEGWVPPKYELQIQQWSLQGRLLIRTDKALNANINWKHNGSKDELSLFGALGLGKKKIAIDGKKISLDEGDGQTFTSTDVDGFIARQLGFVVPLTALRRWVLGLPVKGKPVVKVKDGFKQLGWQIKGSRFKPTAIGIMPHKLKISKNGIKLILIIDQWEK